jgi:hypothetical protein
MGRCKNLCHPKAGKVSGSRAPFNVKASAIIKRFLRSYSGRGQGSVEVGAPNSFLFGDSLSKKTGKASDESVASP